jgi:ABC-2 type transport system ATP-binding protein
MLLDSSRKGGVADLSVLQVEHLTKDYGSGRGVFDVSFAIEQGEVFGFLGPNGAGKTTTIRHLLGFSKPQGGRTSIVGIDCWKRPKDVQRRIGYLPGEIKFANDMTGWQFLRFMAEMRRLPDLAKAERLMKQFDLNPSGDLKRMSKGMKQKIAITCAFMHDPEILVLDEPTSGLDPLMRSVFLDLIREEKRNGRSILMSSHMFEEVEDTCDRVGIIKLGRMVATVLPKDIRHAERKTFKIEFLNASDFRSMVSEGFDIRDSKPDNNQVVVDIEDDHINDLLAALSRRKVKFISEIKHNLEEFFMDYYRGDGSRD